MTLRAAFFDVGDTLVEHWAPREVVSAHARAQVRGDPAGIEVRPDAVVDDLTELPGVVRKWMA